MDRRRRGLLAPLALALAATLACGGRPRALDARLSVAASLGGGAAGFARALAPRPFVFPADHGPHPEFRSEWWYYTGNLTAPEGRRFGFQLTIFRQALAPRPPERESAWAASQVYLAHFALSDVARGRFRSFERVSRGALGLAGARAAPFRAWLATWSAAGPPLPRGAASATPMHLTAAAGAGDGGAAIDLTLDPGKPPVLQGDRGLSRKGTEPGQASYYYSLTRMPARGTVRAGGETLPVAGLAWMDREWSTSSLGRGLVGWDWFAMQLDDGREVMLYRLRRRDGGADPASQGTLVERDGASRPLAWSAVRLTPAGGWTSPRSGARYPARWRLAIPAEGLDLDLRPDLADQELDTSYRYWEGAVGASGTAGGRPVAGSGYVELTGYGEGTGAGDGGGAPR
jgi:predicted secreted hydrolase